MKCVRTAGIVAAVQRKLILVTRSAARLDGATLIEPGYPRDHTPEQMRGWAHDLDRYNHLASEERDRILALPADERSPEEARMDDVHSKHFVEHQRAINGMLRDDGVVELDAGRHRAGYMVEQGVDLIPVWLKCDDERQLDEFDRHCARERTATIVREDAARHVQSRGRDEPPPRDAGGARTREAARYGRASESAGGDRGR